MSKIIHFIRSAIPKLEVLNNKIAYWLLAIVAIIAFIIYFFGAGIEDKYILYEWNDNKVIGRHEVVIGASTITVNLCGKIIAGYSGYETEIWAGIQSDIPTQCASNEDNLRSSLYYALDGNLKLIKRYNKVILTDELRGNVFVLKRAW